MSFKSALVGNVYLVQFDAFEPGDGALILRAVEEAFETMGHRLIYIAVAGRLRPPDDRIQAEITQAFERVLSLCAQVHLVVLQQGFVGALHRTIAAGMLLLMNRQAKNVSIHASLEAALVACKRLLTIDGDIVIKIARARGIVPER